MRPVTTSLVRLAVAALLAPLAGGTLHAQDAASKLSLHGYLTQGAAVSDSSQVIGIGEDGTTSYRRAALLLRYAQTPRDAFVVQVAHRRLGDSPIMAFESDVKVDWAFYERRFGDYTSLRVGKTPIPFGIYNETRYIGTLLPFYRAPYALYFEGAYTSETVDGAVLSSSFLAETPFRLDASVYAGNYSLLEFTHNPNLEGGFDYALGEAQAENAIGSQLWMSTPLEGLRVGGGISRATMEGGVLRTGGRKETKNEWHAGLDADFDRFDVRGEFLSINFSNLRYRGWYAQAGAHVVGGLSVNAQTEVGTVKADQGPMHWNIPLIRDNAIGATYAFRSDLVFKAEAHETKGFNVEQGSNIFTADPSKGRYYITSLSLAF